MSKAGSVLEKIEYDEEGNFTSVQIGRFKEDPEFYMTFVKAVEEQVNNNFQIVRLIFRRGRRRTPANHFNQAMKDSDTHQYVTQMVAEYMKAALGDDEVLIKALVPSFPLGCRRLTPGVGYLESLTQPNVEVVSDSIVQITSNGLVTKSGRTIEVDAIICATGFNVSFCPRFPLVGRAGNLQDTWAKELPQAYMSCAVPNLPNYFGESLHVDIRYRHHTNTLTSIPGSQRSNRTRKRLYHHRASCQVHRGNYSEMPNGRHQSYITQPSCCSRVERAHANFHASDCMGWELYFVV